MQLVSLVVFVLFAVRGQGLRAPAWFPSCLPRRRHLALSSGSGLGLNKPPMELCDENAAAVIDEIRKELGTIFGYTSDSRAVGITGSIDLVEVDGPTIRVSLAGRFWHATDTVMMRVESYIKNRIPEVIEVELDMSKSQIQDDNRLNTDGGKKLF